MHEIHLKSQPEAVEEKCSDDDIQEIKAKLEDIDIKLQQLLKDKYDNQIAEGLSIIQIKKHTDSFLHFVSSHIKQQAYRKRLETAR